jgi:hypothetical protein
LGVERRFLIFEVTVRLSDPRPTIFHLCDHGDVMATGWPLSKMFTGTAMDTGGFWEDLVVANLVFSSRLISPKCFR